MSKAAANAGFHNLALELKPAEIAVGMYHPGVVSRMIPVKTSQCLKQGAAKGFFKDVALQLWPD